MTTPETYFQFVVGRVAFEFNSPFNEIRFVSQGECQSTWTKFIGPVYIKRRK